MAVGNAGTGLSPGKDLGPGVSAAAGPLTVRVLPSEGPPKGLLARECCAFHLSPAQLVEKGVDELSGLRGGNFLVIVPVVHRIGCEPSHLRLQLAELRLADARQGQDTHATVPARKLGA